MEQWKRIQLNFMCRCRSFSAYITVEREKGNCTRKSTVKSLLRKNVRVHLYKCREKGLATRHATVFLEMVIRMNMIIITPEYRR